MSIVLFSLISDFYLVFLDISSKNKNVYLDVYDHYEISVKERKEYSSSKNVYLAQAV